MRILIFGVLALVCQWSTAQSAELTGPGRFCGYSPIIDLLPGEKVTVLEGGIHAGSFRWEGNFGSLDVKGIGWASRPKGRIIHHPGTEYAVFAQRRNEGHYTVAIWNGAHGAAYFQSDKHFSEEQYAAIDRVRLFEEGEQPSNCMLRTSFSLE
ncbi:hypothetical protein [Asticcacaulis benevestitus]|uniref:hypothetical protein n=1 Tax=Asticcacaulis benevestitus TaxID=347481 RepID=UPI0009DB35AA|nr:hypothetical protein [Asticcacaulis benevestitus]